MLNIEENSSWRRKTTAVVSFIREYQLRADIVVLRFRVRGLPVWKIHSCNDTFWSLFILVLVSLPVILEYLWSEVGSFMVWSEFTEWAMAEAFFSLNIITFKLSSFPNVISPYLELVISWIGLHHLSISVVNNSGVICHWTSLCINICGLSRTKFNPWHLAL